MQGVVARHRRGLRRAERARRPAALADRELQRRLRDDRGAQPRARGDLPALPTFERESTMTLARLTEFSKDTNPLVTQLRPAARQLSPDAAGPRQARARPQGPLPQPQPAVRRRRGGPPGDRGLPRRAASAAGQLRRAAAPAQPAAPGPRAVQERADRLLRQHGGDHAGHDAGGQRARALPAHEQPGEPREPRRLSAPDPHEPSQSVRLPRRVQGAGRRAALLRDPPVHRRLRTRRS